VAHKYRNGFQPTFHPESLTEPSKWKKPQRVFVCSMSDLFHKEHDFNDIRKVYFEMQRNKMHTFLILTKRPLIMKSFFDKLISEMTLMNKDWMLADNIWLGVTAENQEQADKRIPILLSIQAAKHFVSCEPLLENISLIGDPEKCKSNKYYIDWVIAGGETGRNARPVHPDWIRALRDECKEFIKPFFFKQWGEFLGEDYCYENGLNYPDKLIQYEHAHNENYYKIGKTKAGRLLDGREWNQIPEVSHG